LARLYFYMIDFKQKLSKEFFTRNLNTVAKELLGKIFIRNLYGKILAGKIVEVEAYDGSVDEAAHTFRGKTKRNEVMFENGGLLYVYFTYGMHFCCNVVTGKANEGKALLIRALEPLEGIEQMSLNRFGKKEISHKELINLINGPAKVCQAFKIARKENGTDLTGNEIFICDSTKLRTSEIGVSTRIGIKKSIDLPWRYYIKDNPFVSGYSKQLKRK
jgi:DNA-3-methyladenine glycosylase